MSQLNLNGSATDFSIPLTQTAIVFEQNNGPLLVKTDWPVTQAKDLKPGEVLVKIIASGCCHTDLHAHKGDWPVPTKLPLVGGHEGAGFIVGIGEGTQTELKIGDRVGVKWLADSCLACESCRCGTEACCSAGAKLSGYNVDGTFQQYCVSYARHVTPIPDNLSFELAAPILCAGVTVYKAVKNASCKPGDWILISGAGGGLGHLALQYARALGLRTLAIDTSDAKKELCTSLGAETFIDFKTTKDMKAAVFAATNGLGVHAAVIASANPKSYEEALDYIRPNGTLVAVGLPATGNISANVFWTVFKSLTIKGSYVGNRQDAIEALDLAARGLVKSTVKLAPLKDLEKVFRQMEDGTINGRIVLMAFQ